jgi:cob(I)alamin adenosyltransferase
MKLYTKTGDDGDRPFGGARVPKASARVDAYGTVDDERGDRWRGGATRPSIDAVLARSRMTSSCSAPSSRALPGRETNLSIALLGEVDVQRLRRAIDEADAGCPPLKSHSPGGSQQAAALHVARMVCRRAERAVLAVDDAKARREVVVYLNRLSDLLFALARRANVVAGVADIPWKSRELSVTRPPVRCRSGRPGPSARGSSRCQQECRARAQPHGRPLLKIDHDDGSTKSFGERVQLATR